MRKKSLTFLILVIVMIASLAAALIACDPDDPAADDTSYSTTLIANGNFDEASGDSQPMTPSSWTGEEGSTSSSTQYKTPNGSSNLSAGVIDLADERGYRNDFGSIAPGKKGEDDNILAIYNKTATSYKYTSASVTLSADKVYKLSVWVKTDIYTDASYYNSWLNRDSDETQELDENRTGAYVYVNGVAYAAFEAINTGGQWQELVTYIDTHNSSGGSITVILSLGTGNWSTGYMTAGYAFFDNITLIDLNEEYADGDSEFVDGDSSLDEDAADAKAIADFNAATVGTAKDAEDDHSVHTAKYDMGSGDTSFDYVTKTSTPYSSSRWTGAAGKKTDGTNFSTSSTNLQRGVIDAKNADLSVISGASEYEGLVLDAHESVTYSYGEGNSRSYGNVLYIQGRNENVYGYSSNTTYTIEANNYYKVSVWVKTYIKNGSGAAVRLTSGDDDENIVSLSNISTNGAWQEYSLYLRGNQYRKNTVTLELWLGESNTAGTKGIVFFDSVAISKISAEDYEAAEAGTNVAKDDMLTPDKDYKYYGMSSGENVLSYAAKASSSSFAQLANAGETADGIAVDKALQDRDEDGVWLINNKVPAYASISPVVDVDADAGVDTSNLIKLAPNSYLALSVWIKTSEITKGGLTVTLYNYDIKAIEEDLEESNKTDYSDLSSYRSSVSSLSSLTSETLEDFKIDGVNDYIMVTFMVQSGKETAYLGFEFALGSGTPSNSSSYVKGYAMISNVMTEKITAADYSSASSASNLAKGSISGSSSSVEIASNGYFNTSDISGTNSLYADDDNEFDFSTNRIDGVLALPDGWSATDSSLLTAYLDRNDASDPAQNYAFGGVLDLDGDMSGYTGIAGVNSSIKELLGDTSTMFESAGDYSGLNAGNNVLALYSHRLAAFGFSSDEFTLSANSYYRVSVWAYAPDTPVSVMISTGSDDSDHGYPNTVSTKDGWTEYVFYIQTGVSSVSASLSLYVGNCNYATDNTGESDYSALFTGATYQSMTEEDFDSLVSVERENTQTLSMLVDTMDNVSENDDDLNTPSDWTGSMIDSDASDDDVSAGVFDRQNHDWEELLDLNIASGEADEAIASAIYNSGVVDKNINNSSVETGIGDMVLVIYNHDDVRDDEGNLTGGAYSFDSASMSLSAGKYYKITVWVLTYKLGKDDSARVILTLGNSTYTFGASVDDDSSAVDKARRINTSTYDEDGNETVGSWQEISFYVYIDEDVEESVSGTLTLQLGDTDEWVSGYAFFDNFSCVEISERTEGETTVTPAEIVSDMVGFDVVYTDSENAENNNVFCDENAFNEDGSIKDGAKLAGNYIVRYTQADAEKAPEEEDPDGDGDSTSDLLWLYIVSGIIGGLIVIAVIVVIARKVMSKRKRQKDVSKKSEFDRNYGGRSNARKK